jgi:hypothetical protein
MPCTSPGHDLVRYLSIVTASPSRRSRAERPHKAVQIWLPDRCVVKGEMPVCLVAVGDQYIAAVMNLLHRTLDRARLGWIGLVFVGVDQQYLGFDLQKVGSGL